MNTEDYDILFRSRKTLLSILDKKGYDITPYEKFGPWEIEAMIQSKDKNTLHMKLSQKKELNVQFNCVVVYCLNRVKLSLPNFLLSFVKEYYEEKTEKNKKYEGNYIKNPETTEVIVILLEPVNAVDAFDNASLMMYNKHKLRMSFFQANNLVNNPSDHILVPKHELIDPKDVPELKKKLNKSHQISLFSLSYFLNKLRNNMNFCTFG